MKNFLLGSTDGWLRKVLIAFWIVVFAIPVGFVLVFAALSFTELPSVVELENPKNNEASPIVAADGAVLGRFFVENRVMVDFKALGPHLESALVSTEDERYYNHSGIDWQSMPRVIIKTAILGNNSAGGGSTITQQLAKLLFTEQVSANIIERGFQKLKEWIIAVRLERKYTKQEIIAMYLNRYDFINGAQGIRAAAENYFDGKRPAELDVQEAATLVGMLKNASLYNPLRFEDRVVSRRNQVMRQMVRNDRLTEVQYDSLSQLPLGVTYSRQQHDDGLAPYFRMVLGEESKRILETEAQRKADGTAYDIYRDGLTFYTTIDPDMQRIAEAQAREHMRKLQQDFFDHWKGRDPWTFTNPLSETEVRVDRRQQSLRNAVRQSDRYQMYRRQILGPVLRKIGGTIDFRFSNNDREIDRMLAEQDTPGTIADAVRYNMISEEFAASHREVMELPEFAELKTAYAELQETVKEEFDREVEMRVFTYDNDRMETDTLMTPLDSVRYHKMILQIGSISVEPGTGYVKTWIGGSNFKWFQFDHVTTRRQVGSTFKPFVYAASVDLRGISPCLRVLDQPTTISPGDGNFHMNKEWTPPQLQRHLFVRRLHPLPGTEELRQLRFGLPDEGAGEYGPRPQHGGQHGYPEGADSRRALHRAGLGRHDGAPAYGGLHYLRQQWRVQPPGHPHRASKTVPAGLSTNTYRSSCRRSVRRANYVMVNMLSKASVGALQGVRGRVGGKTGHDQRPDRRLVHGAHAQPYRRHLGRGRRTAGSASATCVWGAGSNMAKPFFRRFVSEAQQDEAIAWDTDANWIKPPGEETIETDCDAYGQANDDLFEEEGGARQRPLRKYARLLGRGTQVP